MGSSPMKDHPEHVQAIGMATIELANLEQCLAILLMRILGQNDLRAAQAIYFTPLANIARIETVGNVAEALLGERPEELMAVKDIVRRAIKLTGKRHAIIHGSWMTNSTGTVLLSRLSGKPGRRDSRVVDLKELTDIVEGLQSLIADVLNYVFPPPPLPKRRPLSEYHPVPNEPNTWADPTGHKFVPKTGRPLEEFLAELIRDGLMLPADEP